MGRKTRLLALTAALCMALSACGSAAEGGTGDTLETYFFSFSVDSAALADTYGGKTAGPGSAFLVAEMTVENTGGDPVEMYDVDFSLQWGEGSGRILPITTDPETLLELPAAGENQLPATYVLEPGEVRTGELVYEVLAGQTEFSLSYQEQFVDETGAESVGETYTVTFAAAAE